jgi:hypothetical protein
MLSVSAATNHPDTNRTVLRLPLAGVECFFAIVDTRCTFIEGIDHV